MSVETKLPGLLRQLRRQLLINHRPTWPVGNFPQRHVDRACDLLHFLKVDLVDRVAGTVVVFMLAVEKENYRNALARVVVMVAAKEEAVWILRIVVAIIVGDV